MPLFFIGPEGKPGLLFTSVVVCLTVVTQLEVQETKTKEQASFTICAHIPDWEPLEYS